MAHKIDTATAVTTRPVAAAAGTPGWFTDADPLNPTHLDADWCNSQQAAVTTTVEDSGESLDKADINQFSRIVSGVHGIVTDVRSDLATTGASTPSKRAASAVTDAIADRNYSQCNAGSNQTAHGTYSQCNAGEYQHNSGERASLIGGKYCENIDDDCVCGGFGSSAPAGFRDGLTNKNVKWKVHNDSGNAEFEGDVTVGGEIKGEGTDPLAIGSSVEVLFEDETASVDWATSAADHEAASLLISYTDAPIIEITVTVANSDSSAHDIEMGSSLLLDINGLNSGFTRTLIGAVAETTAGSTNPQKGLRWSCGLIKNSAGVTKLAVTSVGKTTASIAASGADTITVKVRLQYAKLTAI
jgi:hypothetical protein